MRVILQLTSDQDTIANSFSNYFIDTVDNIVHTFQSEQSGSVSADGGVAVAGDSDADESVDYAPGDSDGGVLGEEMAAADEFHFVPVTENEVASVLAKVKKTTKSSYSIHPKIICSFFSFFVKVFTFLFNSFIATNYFPDP